MQEASIKLGVFSIRLISGISRAKCYLEMLPVFATISSAVASSDCKSFFGFVSLKANVSVFSSKHWPICENLFRRRYNCWLMRGL